MSRKPRLCIIDPWVYPLFSPQQQGHFGGWEVRVALIARELARRGFFKVSVVVGDYGQPHIEHHRGITLYSWRGREMWDIPLQPPVSTIPLQPPASTLMERFWRRLRFHFRPAPPPLPPLQPGRIGGYLIKPEMVEIYDEIDADIYTVPGNSQYSGELAFYCKQRGKKYVFLAGSDFDLYPEYKAEPDKLDMYEVPFVLKTYALENAQMHIVQNERQSAMLKQGYGLNGMIIRNPIDIRPHYRRPNLPERILWVGKADGRVKRPSLVFELARRMPDLPFDIILNQGLPDEHKICLKEAKTLPNVTLIERVPFEEVERYYAAARLFVNTSVFEGFPNTFLQAGKYGVPIIATDVDPGGMLSQHGCGITCGGDFERFVESVRRLMADADLYAKMSVAVLHYVRTYHDKDIVIAQYEKAFREVLAR